MIAAVAIFAIGMIGVLALFAPVTKSVAGVSEAEAAARIADGVRARLQAVPFATAAALLEDAATLRKNNNSPAYDPTKNPVVLFAKLNGEVGLFDPAGKKWIDSAGNPVNDADKFFEIDLVRDDTLSPAANDANATLLAYAMRVRWPAFVPTGPGTGVQSSQAPTGSAVAFDHSKKQVLFFTGFVTR